MGDYCFTDIKLNVLKMETVETVVIGKHSFVRQNKDENQFVQNHMEIARLNQESQSGIPICMAIST